MIICAKSQGVLQILAICTKNMKKKIHKKLKDISHKMW